MRQKEKRRTIRFFPICVLLFLLGTALNFWGGEKNPLLDKRQEKNCIFRHLSILKRGFQMRTVSLTIPADAIQRSQERMQFRFFMMEKKQTAYLASMYRSNTVRNVPIVQKMEKNPRYCRRQMQTGMQKKFVYPIESQISENGQICKLFQQKNTTNHVLFWKIRWEIALRNMKV